MQEKPKYYEPKRRSLIQNIGLAVVIFIILGFSLAPIYWGFSAAFKLPGEYYAKPPTLYPVNPSLQPFQVLLQQKSPSFIRGIFNSIVIATLTAFISAFVAFPGSYALIRFAFKGKTLTWVVFFVSQVAGASTFTVIPTYILVVALGLRDTYLALLIPYLAMNIPFATLLMSGFVASCGPELEEAAMVDGCSRIGAIFRITFPILLHGIFTAVILVFALTFNEFILAGTLTRTDASKTAFSMLWTYYRSPFSEWAINSLFAGSLMLSIPVMVLFVVLQRRFVEGFTKGAIKM